MKRITLLVFSLYMLVPVVRSAIDDAVFADFATFRQEALKPNSALSKELNSNEKKIIQSWRLVQPRLAETAVRAFGKKPAYPHFALTHDIGRRLRIMLWHDQEAQLYKRLEAISVESEREFPPLLKKLTELSLRIKEAYPGNPSYTVDRAGFVKRAVTQFCEKAEAGDTARLDTRVAKVLQQLSSYQPDQQVAAATLKAAFEEHAGEAVVAPEIAAGAAVLEQLSTAAAMTALQKHEYDAARWRLFKQEWEKKAGLDTDLFVAMVQEAQALKQEVVGSVRGLIDDYLRQQLVGRLPSVANMSPEQFQAQIKTVDDLHAQLKDDPTLGDSSRGGSRIAGLKQAMVANYLDVRGITLQAQYDTYKQRAGALKDDPVFKEQARAALIALESYDYDKLEKPVIIQPVLLPTARTRAAGQAQIADDNDEEVTPLQDGGPDYTVRNLVGGLGVATAVAIFGTAAWQQYQMRMLSAQLASQLGVETKKFNPEAGAGALEWARETRRINREDAGNMARRLMRLKAQKKLRDRLILGGMGAGAFTALIATVLHRHAQSVSQEG